MTLEQEIEKLKETLKQSQSATYEIFWLLNLKKTELQIRERHVTDVLAEGK